MISFHVRPKIVLIIFFHKIKFCTRLRVCKKNVYGSAVYVQALNLDYFGVMVEHRCCGAASPGSSPHHGYKSQLLR